MSLPVRILAPAAVHLLMGLGISYCVQEDFYLVAGLHGDCERDALESRDEVEGAFFWNGLEAARGVGTNREGAVWFGDLDGVAVRLGERFS